MPRFKNNKLIWGYAIGGVVHALANAVLLALLLSALPIADPLYSLVLVLLPSVAFGPVLGGKSVLDGTAVFDALLPVRPYTIAVARWATGIGALASMLIGMTLINAQRFLNSAPRLSLAAAIAFSAFSFGFTIALLARTRIGVALAWPGALLICGGIIAIFAQVDRALSGRFGPITSLALFLTSSAALGLAFRRNCRREIPINGGIL